MSQGTRQRESTSKTGHAAGHDKRVVNWALVEKQKREKAAQRRRKVVKRRRQRNYSDFIECAFHGKSPVNV